MINRREFIDTLELVKSATADDAPVPIFTNFCFNGSTVYGYRDNIGIMAPCVMDKEFAVHGKTLIELVKTSSAKEIEFEFDKDDNVVMKAGKSRMKLPYLSKSEFLFEEPEDETWDFILELDDHLLEGIRLCLISSSTDHTMAALMGVTMKGGKQPYLYSCDGDALSRYKLDLGVKTKDAQYTMPNEFCEAVLRIAEKTGYKSGQLYVNGEWAIAEFGNDYKVFGRIIANDDPHDFEGEMKGSLKGNIEFCPVPDELASALQRARIVADPENKSTLLTVSGKKLLVNTETHIGVVDDSIKLSGSHPDKEAHVNAKHISRVLTVCDEFCLLDACTVYRKGDDFTLIVANYYDE